MKKLALLGPKGTYCSLASQLLKEQYELVYFPNIIKTINKTTEEQCSLVPIENTLDGFVVEALDAIIKNKLYIVGNVKLKVDFYFVSQMEKLEQVKNCYVQFKAYGQSLDFFAKNNLNPIITQSNMESLDLLNKQNEPGYGAIIPCHIDVKPYNLVIKNVLDAPNNETRFIRLAKNLDLEVKENCNCSIVVRPLDDRPGILYEILSEFANLEINLKAIFSRPRKDMIGKYIFYLEFELTNSELLKTIIKNLKEKYPCDINVVGIYNKV